MEFDLEITITGICAFIEHTVTADPRVCVVLPSTDTDRNAFDDEPLCPHQSYIEQGYGFGLVKTPLRRQRVKFEIVGGVDQGISLPLQKATKDKLGLIELKDSNIIKKTNPAVVYISKAPPAPVMAQILLDKVLLEKGSIEFTPKGGLWDFNPKGGGFQVAHEVIIKLKKLEGASAILEPFDGAQSTYVDLKPTTGVPTVALRIVNTCMRNSYPKKDSDRDRDFKWYYDLLEGLVPSDIGNEDLPIPRLVMGLIGGNNCFPSRLEPAPIQ